MAELAADNPHALSCEISRIEPLIGMFSKMSAPLVTHTIHGRIATIGAHRMLGDPWGTPGTTWTHPFNYRDVDA